MSQKDPPSIVSVINGWRCVPNSVMFVNSIAEILHTEMLQRMPVNGSYFARRQLVELSDRHGILMQGYISAPSDSRFGMICTFFEEGVDQMTSWIQTEPKRGNGRGQEMPRMHSGSTTLQQLWAVHGRAVIAEQLTPAMRESMRAMTAKLGKR